MRATVLALAAASLASAAFASPPVAPSAPGLPANAGSPFDVAAKGNLVPAVHLSHMMLTDKPTVCIVGDSTSTAAQENPVSVADTLWARIEQKLVAENPNKTINFKNFAIGGTTLANLMNAQTTLLANGVTIPFYWPSSYNGFTWLQWVGYNGGCTTLFINFGLNDATQEAPSTWNTTLTRIASTYGWFSTTPDVVIITNPQANPNDAAGDGAASSIAGYLSNAGMQRTVAMDSKQMGVAGVPGVGLVDVGRSFQKAVMGSDPVNQILTYVYYPGANIVEGTTFPFSLPLSPGGDFDLTFTLSDAAGFIAANTTVSVSVGDPAGGASTTANSVHIQYASSQWFMNYYGLTSSINYATTGANCGVSGAITFEIAAKQDHLILSCAPGTASSGATTVADVFLPRVIGPFTPTINVALNAPPGGETLTITQYATGTAAPAPATIPLSTCYNTTGLSPGPSGGQSSKHFTSVCLNQVYAQALSEVSFAETQPKTSALALSAAGTTQATALALQAAVNVISTCASGAGAVLPAGATGVRVTVSNNGANSCSLYPPSGAAINALAVNAAYSLSVGATADFIYQSPTAWAAK